MQSDMTEAHSAITELIARFDDAVNCRDVKEFTNLWHKDAVWKISEPMPMYVQGAEAIVRKWTAMLQGTQWLFRGSFAGVVSIDGDKATGRWPCMETGSFADGTGYDNRAFYDDKYARSEGQWYFKERHYVYLWLSNEKLSGGPIKQATSVRKNPDVI